MILNYRIIPEKVLELLRSPKPRTINTPEPLTMVTFSNYQLATYIVLAIHSVIKHIVAPHP